jgi:hypothetical protein
MTRRRGWPAAQLAVPGRLRTLALAAGAAVALAAAVVALVDTHSVVEAAKALLAAAIAVAAAGLATTLPGITVRGAVIGGLFVLAGFLSWTFTNNPWGVWTVLAVTAVIVGVWSWPWQAYLPALPRLGTAWLGLAYWLLGIIGAVLSVHLGVAGQRLAYAAVFTLAALAVLVPVGRPGRAGGDPSVGIAAAIIVGLAALLLAGSATVFDPVHAIPNHDPSTVIMRYRFWGGPGLYFHPNSMAGLAVIMAIRIGPDRAFTAWQRLTATLLAGFVLYLSDSRIGFWFAVTAALVHGVLILLRRHTDLPRYRRPWLAILVPFAVLAVVLALSGGRGFLFQSRFGGDDVTSGRTTNWKQVWTDWRADGLPEKAFGDAKTARGVIVRPGTDHKLNTDNAAVGAFRRGGVLGLLAFAVGLVLMLWHALVPQRHRGPPGARAEPAAAWFVIAAVAAVPTVATEDWLLGGTNGAIWLVLLVGEATVLWGDNRPAAEGEALTAHPPGTPPGDRAETAPA